MLLRLGILIALILLGAGPFFRVVAAEPPQNNQEVTVCQSYLSETSSIVHKLTYIEKLRHELEAHMAYSKDPFLFSSSLEEGLAIWKSMIEGFPLLVSVRQEVNRVLENQGDINPALEHEVFERAKLLLDNIKTAENQVIAGAIEALRRLELVYLRRASIEKENDSKRTEKIPPKSEKKEQKKPNEEKIKSAPQYPNISRTYQAKNKEMGSGEPGQKKLPLARVNKPGIGYFRSLVYAAINARRSEWATVELPHSLKIKVTDISQHSIRIKSLDRKGESNSLLIPQGFLPVPFKNAKGEVWEDDTGNFYFRTDLDEIEVPLLPQGKSVRPLSIPEREIYTAPTGVRLEEWPLELQEFIHSLQKESVQGLEIAQNLAHFISHHYLYRVDQDPMLSAPELARHGKFQCDGAATILASILRDVFKIPCRIVGGFQGMHRSEDPNASYVVLPSDGHAWVEVADDNGNWHGVDPTPSKKERENEKDLEEKTPKEFLPIGPSENVDATKSDKFDGTPKTLEQIIEETKKLQEKKKLERLDKTGIQKSIGAGDPAQIELPVSKADEYLIKLSESNPWSVRFLKRAVFWAIDPSLATPVKVERLQQLKAALDAEKSAEFQYLKFLRGALSEATRVFVGDHPEFDRWLDFIIQEAPFRSLNKTMQELSDLTSHIEYTLKFLDPIADAKEREPLVHLLQGIRETREAIGSIKHPDAKAIRVAQDLYENLPGNISRELLKKKYALESSLGEDVGTLSLAKDISEGKHSDLRMLSILGPHTDFLVAPIYKNSRGNKRTWDPALKRQKGRSDILLTGDPRQRDRFVRIYDYLTDEQALASGQMGVQVQRRKIEFPTGYSEADPEKATVIAIDTSGSMAGTNAYFQSMYVGALVDKALSDVNPNGKARHRVYILGFDSTVHSEIEITSREQATEILKDLKEKTKNTAGSTDIQKALIYSANLLKRANERGDKALARANVLIASDGGAPVDVYAVQQAFRSIGPRTSLMLACIAIGGENPALFELSKSEQVGTAKQTYINWSQDDIAKVIHDAKSTPNPVNDFWTKLNWADLPVSILRSFDGLLQTVGRFRVETSNSFWSDIDHFEKTEEIKAQTHRIIPQRARERRPSHAGRIHAFRRLLNFMGPRFTPEQRALLLEGVFRSWPELVNESVDELAALEIAEIHHVLQWPQKGYAGEK